MSEAAEPMYRIQRGREPIESDSDWLCVAFKRLGKDADPEDIITRRLSRPAYREAILGNMIKGRDLGGTNWFEHAVDRLPFCG
ncbi:MAG: hypothetical protein M3P26_04195 [Gemmatimonadota bacterium]|nr:hypothetical protein [Gemmatimonadota bacterium]